MLPLIDDRDPRIEYSGNWTHDGVGREYKSTTRGARSVGSTANFNFNGTGTLGVYGTVTELSNCVSNSSTNSSVSTYSIDGVNLSTVTKDPSHDIQYKQQYFKSSVTAEGPHILNIRIVNADCPFYLDYLELGMDSQTTLTVTVTSTAAPAATTSGSPPDDGDSSVKYSTSSPASASKTSPGDMSSSEGPDATSHASPASSKGVPAGAITGAVIGGIIVLFLFTFILLRRRRIAREQAMYHKTHHPTWTPHHPKLSELPYTGAGT